MCLSNNEMTKNKKIEHEGIIQSLSAQSLDVLIDSYSACSGCHAKGACGMSDMKQKTITVRRPAGDFHVGDRVMVYANMSHAFYSVLLAYVLPSFVIIGTIFFIEKFGSSELTAALSSLGLLALYFVILYLCRNRISKKITFAIAKTSNY